MGSGFYKVPDTITLEYRYGPIDGFIDICGYEGKATQFNYYRYISGVVFVVDFV